VYPLNNVPTVREDPLNVLGVDGGGEVGVAVVAPFSRGGTDVLK